MNSNAYTGSARRTFRQALIHRLETQYGLLGSQRVLELLSADIQELAEQFYPAPEHLAPGWMIFTGTAAQGAKAYPGKRACDYELVSLAWPVLLPEDLDFLASHPETQSTRKKSFRQRLVRIIEHGLAQPSGAVLLTLSDLGAMLGLGTVQISQLLEQARQETGKELPTKGYYFDQGMRPSHKEEIIRYYESGMNEAEIARRCRHGQGSVGSYIRDYERVKLLLQYGLPPEELPMLTDLKPGVVEAYANFVAMFHPEIYPANQALNQASND